MPIDLDGRESTELPIQVALWDAIDEVVAASGGSTTNSSVTRQKAVVRVHSALQPLTDELCALRARVVELEREYEIIITALGINRIRSDEDGSGQ